MSQENSILVLGAGELGLSILRSLTDHAHSSKYKISVLLRPSTISNPDSSKQELLSTIASLGAHAIPGDVVLSSSQALANLFAKQDIIISANGMNLPPGTQTKVLHAILVAKPKLYIPWQFGVDYDAIGGESAQDLFTEQLRVRQTLRAQQDVRWIILSTGIFTSFLFEPSFGVVDLEAGAVRGLGTWETSVTTTAVEDIGRVVAELVYGSLLGSDIVFIAGQTISYSELADVTERVLGTSVRRQLWDIAHLKKELASDPENGMKKYRLVFAEGIGVSWPEDKTWDKKNGVTLTDTETWLKQNLVKGKKA